jgi:hypothetical protein
MENLTTNCSLFYSDQNSLNVAVTSAAISGVSLLACLSALFIVVLFKKWQSFGQRLIAYLLISTALLSMAVLLWRVDFDDDFTPADVGFCAFSGFAVQIAVWNVIDSIIAVTLYLFLGIVCDRFTGNLELLYILFIFVVPLVFSWIPFIHNTYGPSGVWCWIKLVDLFTCERLVFGQVLQLALFYVPSFVIFPFIILLYLVILCKLGRNRKRWKGIGDTGEDHSIRIMSLEIAQLLAYPLIFFLLGLPNLVFRVQLWVAPDRQVLAFLYLSVISGNLLGVANSLAFLLDKDTRHRLKWSHIRAAFKNYRSGKGISEYTYAETKGEPEASGDTQVPYSRFKSDYVMDQNQDN